MNIVTYPALSLKCGKCVGRYQFVSARFLSWEGVFQDLMRPKRWKGKVSCGTSFRTARKAVGGYSSARQISACPLSQRGGGGYAAGQRSLYRMLVGVCAKVRGAYVYRTCTRVGRPWVCLTLTVRANRTAGRCWLGIRIINYNKDIAPLLCCMVDRVLHACILTLPVLV